MLLDPDRLVVVAVLRHRSQTVLSRGCVQRASKAFEITLTEGRNRQIRKMCQALGYSVVRLHRTAVAGISLDGLQPGSWCDLCGQEREIVDRVLTEAERASVDQNCSIENEQEFIHRV